jgi:two-component system, NarL family, response regulator LiaR
MDDAARLDHQANGAQAPSAIVADDDPLARRVIKDALQRAGVVVIAEAHNGREAVELTLHYRPEVVLMDIVMPELDGIAATRRIAERRPEQLVVILTSADDDEIGLLGLRAGASGYLTKELDIDMLPRALLRAIRGEPAITPRLTMRLVVQLRGLPERVSGLRPVRSPLTTREWEVIDLLAESRTTAEIADALVLSRETVRSHVKNIRRKLDARSPAEAVEVAQRMREAAGRDQRDAT